MAIGRLCQAHLEISVQVFWPAFRPHFCPGPVELLAFVSDEYQGRDRITSVELYMLRLRTAILMAVHLIFVTDDRGARPEVYPNHTADHLLPEEAQWTIMLI